MNLSEAFPSHVSNYHQNTNYREGELTEYRDGGWR